MVFMDREHAGRLLAERLECFRAERPVILGLTRGGVPVALAVAHALGAPLDIVVVRKLGAPDFPEYALGAVAEDGCIHLNTEAIRAAGLDDQEIGTLAERETAELARRVRAYRPDLFRVDLAGRTVILVDDGVATGATARAAAQSARKRGADRLVLAAPVISAASAADLRADFEEIVALETPTDFSTLRSWYDRFEQLSVDDVLECRRRAAAGEPPGGLPGEFWNGEWNDATTTGSPTNPQEQSVAIPFGPSALGPGRLEGILSVPVRPEGLVIFVHESGSNRRSLRDRFVADALQRSGFATLLFDLLTPEETADDAVTRALRFDVELLTGRVVAALRWVDGLAMVDGLRVGCFGSDIGAAAALAAAALRPELVSAVVSRGGRPDLVDPPVLGDVRAPVLLIAGELDEQVLTLNRLALGHLPSAELTVIPGARHLFEEPGALEGVVERAREWYRRHLNGPRATSTQEADIP